MKSTSILWFLVKGTSFTTLLTLEISATVNGDLQLVARMNWKECDVRNKMDTGYVYSVILREACSFLISLGWLILLHSIQVYLSINVGTSDLKLIRFIYMFEMIIA